MPKAKEKVEIKLPDGKRKKSIIQIIIIFLLIVAGSILGFFNISLNIKVSDLENQEAVELVIDTGSKIEFAENQEIETVLETEDGEIEVESLPVVDMVDGGEIQIEDESLDFGKGEFLLTILEANNLCRQRLRSAVRLCWLLALWLHQRPQAHTPSTRRRR